MKSTNITSKIAKNLNAKNLDYNSTKLDDYFRSPIVADNQKVLFALLWWKNNKKDYVDLSNSFIAEFLNKKGMYEVTTKEMINFSTGEIIPAGTVNTNKIVYERTYIKNDKVIVEPLYTTTGVSNAIKKWEIEGLLSCTYEYQRVFGKAYKYKTTRKIKLDIDKIRLYLSVFSLDDAIYRNLPARSRKRKLIKSRPVSILDNLQELFMNINEELKKRYKTAKGLYDAFIYNINRKFNVKTTFNMKPYSTFTKGELASLEAQKQLKAAVETPPDIKNLIYNASDFVDTITNSNLKKAFHKVSKR